MTLAHKKERKTEKEKMKRNNKRKSTGGIKKNKIAKIAKQKEKAKKIEELK